MIPLYHQSYRPQFLLKCLLAAFGGLKGGMISLQELKDDEKSSMNHSGTNLTVFTIISARNTDLPGDFSASCKSLIP